MASSDDFDFLFVAGHYQILDVRGYYDPLLKAKVLPLLHKYNVNAYLQGHYHTLEHAQENFRSLLGLDSAGLSSLDEFYFRWSKCNIIEIEMSHEISISITLR